MPPQTATPSSSPTARTPAPGNVDIDFGGKNITVTSQHGAASTIIDCQGTSSANHRGFYLHSGEAKAVISGLTVENGYESGAGGSGGGLFVANAGISVLNSVFQNNAVTGVGGGVYCEGSNNGANLTATITNCIFAGNAAGYGGGGTANGGMMLLTNCVFTGNTTSNRYGGLYNLFNATLIMTNCTFTGSTGGGIGSDNGGMTLVNDIFFADNGTEIGGTPVSASYCDIQGGYAGTGNINADPSFFNSPTDLHLGLGSSCLSAGTASGAPTTTIDQQTRPKPPSIGAYERSRILTVPAEFVTIQAAINASVNGDTVLIADGTYTGPGNVDIDFGGKNLMVTSVNGATSTIIDCQGSSSINHRGFYIRSGETNAFISGLTIENGYESGNMAGGIAVFDSTATIDDCIITHNDASDGGGGIAYGNSNSDGVNNRITIQGCTITYNTSQYGCGGISTRSYNINNSTASSTSVLSNCVISNNTGGEGGISIVDNGTLTMMTNCTVTNNMSNSEGGGLESEENGGILTLTNCTVTNNSAMYSGGGVYNYDFTGSSTNSLTLINTIIYGNSGGEAATSSGGTSGITANYCDIEGGYPGTGNINADPRFVAAPTDLHLKPGSPCTGAGTANGAPATDKDGKTRPNPPSIGAYEGVPVATSA